VLKEKKIFVAQNNYVVTKQNVIKALKNLAIPIFPSVCKISFLIFDAFSGTKEFLLKKAFCGSRHY
jgi:hypothetical protein